MKEIYIARDKDGWWRSNFQKIAQLKTPHQETIWNVRGFANDNSQLLEALFPFIKPGEQWKREYVPNITDPYSFDRHISSEGICYTVRSFSICEPEEIHCVGHKWTRIATLDEEPEEKFCRYCGARLKGDRDETDN